MVSCVLGLVISLSLTIEGGGVYIRESHYSVNI